jgi:AhpD family alkylhydroperoxidase
MNPQDLHVIQALEKASATEHLTDREKQLIGLAVTITRGCTHCTGGRIEKALKGGITQDTLTATADLVAAVNAGVAVRTVLQGMEGLSCDGPECSS